jgi:hypothetical protein
MSRSIQTQQEKEENSTAHRPLVRGGVALIFGSAAVVLAKALLGGSLLRTSDPYDGLHSLVSYSSRMIAGMMHVEYICSYY